MRREHEWGQTAGPIRSSLTVETLLPSTRDIPDATIERHIAEMCIFRVFPARNNGDVEKGEREYLILHLL